MPMQAFLLMCGVVSKDPGVGDVVDQTMSLLHFPDRNC